MNQTFHINTEDCRRGDNRIPLGFDVLWDHTDASGRLQEGWDKAFEARGVNLSTGGLAMRVPFLPDVGERLACKITIPSPSSTPKCIVAGTEVVWASSEGQRLGEVGLRFVDLPNEHESLLESLLRGRYRPPTPQMAMKRTAEQISVDLEGVSDAIVATVVESDEGGVTVEQPLPFLRIGAPAQLHGGSDEPRSVHLSAVDLVVEGDMPKLLLDLSYDKVSRNTPQVAVPTVLSRDTPQVAVPAVQVAVPAVQGSKPELHEAALLHRSHVRAETDSTAPGIPAPDQSQQARIVQGSPLAADPDDTIPDAEPEADLTASPAIDEVGEAPRVRQPSGTHALDVQSPVDRVALDDVAFDHGDADFEASISALRQPHPHLELAVTRIKTWARVVASLLRTYAGICRRRVLPGAQRVSKELGGQAFKSAQRIGRTLPRLLPLQSRRRTSQFPEVRPQRSKRVQEGLPLNKRRWMGPAILALGVVLGAYALWPSEGTEAETQEAEAVQQGSSNVELAQPEEIELSVADSFMEPLPEPPSALPDLPPEPTHGQAPAYQTQTANSAATVQQGSAEFGAANVASARTYRLRMSRPIDRLEGRAESNGFVVRIPRSLSLDRAGPISASHPLVRRSMILNHGDYAELTIQFSDQGTPQYRVRGVGSELELLIGTKI